SGGQNFYLANGPKLNFTLKYRILIAVVFVCFVSLNTKGSTINIIASTNWSAITTGSGVGGLPGILDVINIKNNAIVTVDVSNAICSYLQIGASGGSSGPGTLLFNAGSQLSQNGNTAVFVGASATNNGIIDMTAGGTFIVNKIVVNNGINAGILIPGNGTIIVQ